jgi:hypothetical protein
MVKHLIPLASFTGHCLPVFRKTAFCKPVTGKMMSERRMGVKTPFSDRKTAIDHKKTAAPCRDRRLDVAAKIPFVGSVAFVAGVRYARNA